LETTGPGTETVSSKTSALGSRDVYVVDDDADMRKSLRFLLSSSSITAWPFAAAADFIDLLPTLRPAPILLDMRMPGIDGMQMLGVLKERAIAWPVIVMTAHGDVSIAVRAMKLGAIEFLEKPFQSDVLKGVLDQAFAIIDGSKSALSGRDDARRLLGQLSKRESEIVVILMKGLANKAAAYRLGLSVRTVEMHRSNALAKLEVRSIAEVVTLVATADQHPQSSPQNDGLS